MKGIDLDIAPGEFVAIVGQSGCGKSTLLRHIAGLEKETSGQIVQNGGRVTCQLIPMLGFMFQDSRLLPWGKDCGQCRC